jgi:hypothetical protein
MINKFKENARWVSKKKELVVDFESVEKLQTNHAKK